MSNKILFLFIVILFGCMVRAATDVDPQKVSTGDKGYSVDEVNRLKDEVLNRKSQMQLLKHLVRNEGVNASYPSVDIRLVNEMSTRYTMYTLNYMIDGESVYSFSMDDYLGKPGVDPKPSNPKFNLAPGTHVLNVVVIYKGNDTGIFSYINDYKVKVEAVQKFQVERDGGVKALEVVAYEKGWILTDFKDRPDLKINMIGNRTLPKTKKVK